MAKIKVECCPCDQGHYGNTYYYCSECNHDCEDYVDKCPKCETVFNEKSEFVIGGDYGNHDPNRF